MDVRALWFSASALALAFGGVAAAQTETGTTPEPKARPAAAASTVSEVLVTAERRATSLQKTAIAAQVFTGADLRKEGVTTVDQLQFATPSMTLQTFGQGDDFNIRGIGKGETNSVVGVGVITYRDGVAT